jgi:hypothetical protein
VIPICPDDINLIGTSKEFQEAKDYLKQNFEIKGVEKT